MCTIYIVLSFHALPYTVVEAGFYTSSATLPTTLNIFARLKILHFLLSSDGRNFQTTELTANFVCYIRRHLSFLIIYYIYDIGQPIHDIKDYSVYGVKNCKGLSTLVPETGYFLPGNR